jgi:hypothetical protein
LEIETQKQSSMIYNKFILLFILLLAGCDKNKGIYINSSKSDVLTTVSVGDHINTVIKIYGDESFVTKLNSTECKSGIVCYNYESYPPSQIDKRRGLPGLVIFLTCEEKVTDIWFRY